MDRMDRAADFRRGLAERLIRIALCAVPATGVAVVGCSGSVETSGQGGGGSSSSVTDPSSGDGSYTAQGCFAWPQTGMGGMGGAGGAPGAGGMGGAPGTGGAGGASIPPCPPSQDAMQYLDMMSCGGQAQTEGTFEAGQCCYTVLYYGCGAGRPFTVEGQARAAVPLRGRGGFGEEPGFAPVLEGLTSAQRAALARAWAQDGLLEHASVASFGRFAMELLAVGAPSDLLEMAHRAALDEVRHARLTLGLASSYAGEAITPSPFPFEGRVEVSNCLADIAARAVKEGCVGETLASVLAAEQLGRATDPAVRGVLSVIAEDEARHAELAWRVVAWAMTVGGDEVRRAVAEAFAEALGGQGELAAEASAHDEGLEAHGRLSEPALRATLGRAMDEVVRPAVVALLGEN